MEPHTKSFQRTICSVLREMWWISQDRRDRKMLALIDEAHDMAKRMDKKLKQYARENHPERLWDKGFWEKGKEK
jgi:DnaJ-domain-containing protein 1